MSGDNMAQEPVGWFGFDQNTGEFTAEWCSVKPADDTGFRPLYAHPATHAPVEAGLRDAAEALIDFHNLPAQAKRPDIFQSLIARLAATLRDQSDSLA